MSMPNQIIGSQYLVLVFKVIDQLTNALSGAVFGKKGIGFLAAVATSSMDLKGGLDLMVITRPITLRSNWTESRMLTTIS